MSFHKADEYLARQGVGPGHIVGDKVYLLPSNVELLHLGLHVGIDTNNNKKQIYIQCQGFSIHSSEVMTEQPFND